MAGKALHQVGQGEAKIPKGSLNAQGFINNYGGLLLPVFKMLDAPLLLGISRKSMISKTLGIKTEDTLNGTTVLNTIGLMNGASILRVHDVAEAKQAVELVEYYKSV